MSRASSTIQKSIPTEWREQPLSEEDIIILIKRLEILLSIPKKTRPPLEIKDKLAFHLLAGMYSDKIFAVLTKLDKEYPDLKDMQREGVYVGISPLMTALYSGNFLYAQYLLDLEVGHCALDQNGNNALYHISTTTYRVDYRKPPENIRLEVETRLSQVFKEKTSIKEDELSTFKRVYLLLERDKSMNGVQQCHLLKNFGTRGKEKIVDYMVNRLNVTSDEKMRSEIFSELLESKKIEVLVFLEKHGFFKTLPEKYSDPRAVNTEGHRVKIEIFLDLFNNDKIEDLQVLKKLDFFITLPEVFQEIIKSDDPLRFAKDSAEGLTEKIRETALTIGVRKYTQAEGLSEEVSEQISRPPPTKEELTEIRLLQMLIRKIKKPLEMKQESGPAQYTVLSQSEAATTLMKIQKDNSLRR